MRTLHAIAVAAVTSFAVLAPAAAQTPAPGTTIQVPGTPGAKYKLTPQEFADYRGTYLLSNGKSMSVVNRNWRYYVEIDGQPRAELVPVGYDVFVARDADVMIMFNEFENGRVNDVVLRSRRSAIGDLAMR